jgi:hypothetical protein
VVVVASFGESWRGGYFVGLSVKLRQGIHIYVEAKGSGVVSDRHCNTL